MVAKIAFVAVGTHCLYLISDVCASDSAPELLIGQEELTEHLHAACGDCLHSHDTHSDASISNSNYTSDFIALDPLDMKSECVSVYLNLSVPLAVSHCIQTE